MNTALEYARKLIEFNSVSHRSNVPVTEYLQEVLQRLGFETERVDFDDPHGVRKTNVIGRLGPGEGGLAYFGHSDVVPVGHWSIAEHGPFEPVVRDGRLYGRGSTDMKGSIACFLAAVESLQSGPFRSPVYFCCTADEEVGMLGAEYVVQRSRLYQEMVASQTRSIVGEPTRLEVIHAHKGGCGIVVTSRGHAAHSSAGTETNANWKMIPFLAEMKELHERLEREARFQNREFVPPTMSLNLGINDHTAALNITAPRSICTLYFRAMPGIDADPVLESIQESAQRHGLQMEVTFRATPFYVPPDSPFVQECLEFSAGDSPHTVSYGTDAARFHNLKRLVVMGPGNIAQAHTQDEWIDLKDLEQGVSVYRRMLQRWCIDGNK